MNSKISPKRASFNQICDMPRDHTDFGDWCLMTDGSTVWISEQENGKPQKQSIEIPRSVFNRLLRWYETER